MTDQQKVLNTSELLSLNEEDYERMLDLVKLNIAQRGLAYGALSSVFKFLWIGGLTAGMLLAMFTEIPLWGLLAIDLTAIAFAVLYWKYSKKMLIFANAIESLEAGVIDMSFMAVDENGEVVKKVEGEEAMKLFKVDKAGSRTAYSSEEKYKVVVSNIMPTATLAVEDCLKRNDISVVSKSSSAMGRTMEITFAELNDAKAARNVLDADGFSVSHAEEI